MSARETESEPGTSHCTPPSYSGKRKRRASVRFIPIPPAPHLHPHLRIYRLNPLTRCFFVFFNKNLLTVNQSVCRRRAEPNAASPPRDTQSQYRVDDLNFTGTWTSRKLQLLHEDVNLSISTRHVRTGKTGPLQLTHLHISCGFANWGDFLAGVGAFICIPWCVFREGGADASTLRLESAKSPADLSALQKSNSMARKRTQSSAGR